jgi:hypothetical protein
MVALIRARREHTYEIDTASLMLASEDWIPLEGVHELPLVHALIEQRRRFVKPLRYDAATAAGSANALLLDMGATPLPLHVFSAFMAERDRLAKEAAVRSCRIAWVWPADASTLPALPEARP